MNRQIGKVAATEKSPTTIDEFFFWTSTELILNPFDVVKVEHVNNSSTFGTIEEISHITDSASYLSNYISNDFGDINAPANTNRIGMNYVKAKVICNTANIYIPVRNGSVVSLASAEEIEKALGLSSKEIKNPIVCGYLEMYNGIQDDSLKVRLPVKVNADFLIGPEGAHLNISGISGLAAKTSYAMFLLKSLQYKALQDDNFSDVAFILMNVKGRDLLSIDEPPKYKKEKWAQVKADYESLQLDSAPFNNVTYFYPYGMHAPGSYVTKEQFERQTRDKKAFQFGYIYEYDKENLDLLFASIDDPQQTLDSIINFIISGQGNFGNIASWEAFRSEVDGFCAAGRAKSEIPVQSWRKFKRIIAKSLSSHVFVNRVDETNAEVHLSDRIKTITKGDIFVVDVAKQDENMQSFIFGDVMKAVLDLKLSGADDLEQEPPKRIIIFVDELNKYASGDVPKSSPILRQLLDIAERGRSLGIVLFSAEQFRSAIHDRITGNCSTHAYGRTNAIEISKRDYSFVPSVYKTIMTRLEQGEYIIQNPIFRSLLKINFPEPLYWQDK